MNKDDVGIVDNKDDILLVAQAAAAECEEQNASEGVESSEVPADQSSEHEKSSADAKSDVMNENKAAVDADRGSVAEEKKVCDDDDSDDSFSSSSSDEDDDDDLFMRPLPQTKTIRKKPSSQEEDDSETPAKGDDDGDEDEDDDEDDDSNDDDNRKSKVEVTVVKTKNEVSHEDLPDPEPWPDKIDPNEPVEHVGTLCHCVDDIVTVQALPKPDDAYASAIDEGSILCFEDRTVLGRVDEVFGQVSQPFYAIRFGKSRQPDKERCKPGTKVFMATKHTTFVCMEQVLLDRGSDASNLYDEEPAPEELDYSDDEEEARARSLLKQQKQAKRARMTVEELQEKLQMDKRRRNQTPVNYSRQPYSRQELPYRQPQQVVAPIQVQPMVMAGPSSQPQQQKPPTNPPPGMMYPVQSQAPPGVPFNGYVPPYCMPAPPPGMAPVMFVMVPPGGQLPPGSVVMPAPPQALPSQAPPQQQQQQQQAYPYGMYYIPQGMVPPAPPGSIS